ncbi:RNase P, protein component [Candidatus Blochmanniella floridana]|uniref:Ribonuclease P protein component n=1 Tax=Blochmanniella floridana TaxID=203907 RepID=RNPA_BLOFL|nr:RecName: Full=Ribonuclease P protein component; Short=RNase P protein; Short=RNaseP protein; AltName: Full=Protein C5 [Candidatus Blochmannia floridanus]CAD83542.1 RNase P, protein component [Candidatus Blochmannia floridanus]
MNKNHLSKRVRLLKINEFFFVFQKPQRIKVHSMTLFSRSNKLNFPRIGLAISKKYIKHSHERNRIKRHVRETFRTHKHNLLSLDFILTVHSKQILSLTNNNLIEELKKLWYHYQNYQQKS